MSFKPERYKNANQVWASKFPVTSLDDGGRSFVGSFPSERRCFCKQKVLDFFYWKLCKVSRLKTRKVVCRVDYSLRNTSHVDSIFN